MEGNSASSRGLCGGVAHACSEHVVARPLVQVLQPVQPASGGSFAPRPLGKHAVLVGSSTASASSEHAIDELAACLGG